MDNADHVREYYKEQQRRWRIIGDDAARQRLAELTGRRMTIRPPERLYIEYVVICRQLGIEPGIGPIESIEIKDLFRG